MIYATFLFDFLIIAQQTQQPQTSIWVLLISAIVASGTLATGLTLFFNRRKTNSEKEKLDADAADIIQHAAGELVMRIKEQANQDRAEYQKEIDKLMAQNAELMIAVAEMRIEVQKIPLLEADIKDLRNGIDLLTAQLIEHGVQPAYPPQPPINF